MYDIDVRCSLKGYTASTIVKWHCLLPFTSPRFSATSPKSQEMVVVQIVWVCIHMASIAAEVAQPPHIICMRWIWDAVWSTLVKWHRSLPFMLPRIRISAKHGYWLWCELCEWASISWPSIAAEGAQTPYLCMRWMWWTVWKDTASAIVKCIVCPPMSPRIRI